MLTATDRQTPFEELPWTVHILPEVHIWIRRDCQTLKSPDGKRRPFHRSPEEETAFQSVKDALCTTSVLGYPQSGEKFIVDNDASNVGIGGIRSQVQDGQERVIAYFRKTLSKAERNYCGTRRELIAIVKTLEHFTSEHRQGRKHNNADALSRRLCPEECSRCQKVEQRGGGLRVRVVSAAAAVGWDRATLRREQLADDELG
jgi:hypothetical protein